MTATVVIAAAAGFLLYTLFLYPLLLHAIARRRERPVRRGPVTPAVSVLIAARNGAPWLAAKLDSVLELDYPAEQIREILVVSDGSTDETAAIAARYARRGVRLLEVPPGGKARAINAGLPLLTGELVFFTDVRQRLEQDCLRRLAACMADPEVGAVSGELVLLRGDNEEQVNVSAYWRYEFWIRGNLSRLDSIFGATGAIYLMRRALTGPLPEDALLDDMHQPLGAFFRGYRLVVEPGAMAYDHPVTLDNEFRRKVRTLAGNFQILRAFPALLGPGNRMWIHFVSTKLARLLLPYALLAIAGATPWLPAPWALLLGAGQAAFYGLALADPLLPDGSALKRLTAPVRTFTVLMAASLCAAVILFVPAGRLWPAAPAGGRR
jgi:cellulose synthase/poly-beta-1,6-N-acetylglucosamine synthase-like glycosyltransferase